MLPQFIKFSSSYHRNGANKLEALEAMADSSLELLFNCSFASMDAVLAFYGQIVDLSVSLEVDSATKRSKNQAESVLTKFVSKMEEVIKENPDAWSPPIANWCLQTLGDVSSKYISKVFDW